MTDVKNKDGCKLGSCLHADEDSGAGLFPPEHGDGAMAGHRPLHQHPKAKPASLRAQCHQPRTATRHSALEMGPRKLFSRTIRVKIKNQTTQKNPAGMPEEED